MALQEIDHVADAVRDLGALGYECRLPGGQYQPAHRQGITKPDPMAYLTHVQSALAFISSLSAEQLKIDEAEFQVSRDLRARGVGT